MIKMIARRAVGGGSIRPHVGRGGSGRGVGASGDGRHPGLVVAGPRLTDLGPRDRIDPRCGVPVGIGRRFRRFRHRVCHRVCHRVLGFGCDDLDDLSPPDSKEAASLERPRVEDRDLLTEIGLCRVEGFVQRECSKGLQSHGVALLALPDAAGRVPPTGDGLLTI